MGAVGSLVWLDNDGNGTQNANEPGVAEVTIHLYNEADQLVAVTTTDENGNYLFDSLATGIYYIVFIITNDFTFSPIDAVADETNDSDADPSSGRTELIVVEAGMVDLSWNAGILSRPTNVEDGNEPTAPNRIFLPVIVNGSVSQGATSSQPATNDGDTVASGSGRGVEEQMEIFIPLVSRTGLTGKDEATNPRDAPNTISRAPPREIERQSQRAPPTGSSGGQRAPPLYCQQNICLVR